ncbi:MAG: hypothetical protein IPM94_05585 [bacterium]|nr:hypothetical protein [bacterium]
MKSSWRRCALLLLTTALAAGSAATAAAATKLEGYYSIWSAADRTDRNWHFGMPSHYAELKFLNNAAEGVESFVKLRVNANNDDDRTSFVEYYTPPWIAAEGHIKFRSKGTETILFSRQNHFWINDEPLFNLVSDGKLKNDSWGPQSQGVRFEFWDRKLPWLGTWGGTAIYSDDGGTHNWGQGDVRDGVDSWIVRVRNRSWGDRLVGGLMFLRKDWTDTGAPLATSRLGLMNNQVYEADLAFFPHDLVADGLHLGPLDLEQSRWTLEYAVSRVPYQEHVSGHPTELNRLFGAEVRDVHVGNLILHGWYHDAGENFRDFLSGRWDDERKYNRITQHAEGIFFVPRKAITAKVAYDKERLRVPDEIGFGLRPAETWYGEVYVEFIKGFKGKTIYKRWHGFDADSDVNAYATYPDLFAELSVENFLAKIRLQFRLHDFDTFRESSAYGFDMNVNITDKVKGYLRMLDARDSVEARQTAFAQLKYDLGYGAEFYFEYGDPGQSDNIVWTDWFIGFVDPDASRAPGSRLFKDRLAMSFRTWF